MSGRNSRQPHQPSPRVERRTKAVASKRKARRRTYRFGHASFGLASHSICDFRTAIDDLLRVARESNRLRVSTQPSLQNSAHSGQHGGSLPNRKSAIVNHKSTWGRGRQAMHLPCKQAHVGALPTDSTSLRSKRIESGLPRRSEAQAGRDRPDCTVSFELRLGRPIHCGENEIQASLISSASVGATPTPATNLGGVPAAGL